jgi:hypothetical protein
MKTLLACLLVAFAVGGCSSDDSNSNTSLVTEPDGGNTPQTVTCSTTADCESPLTCAFPVSTAGSCSASAKGLCVSLGACSDETVCSCKNVPTIVCTTANYSPIQITGNLNCLPASQGDGGAAGDGG